MFDVRTRRSPSTTNHSLAGLLVGPSASRGDWPPREGQIAACICFKVTKLGNFIRKSPRHAGKNAGKPNIQ
jgi:hypothetical protein